MRLDFSLFDGVLSTEVAHSWHVYERDRVEALDPLKFDAHAFPETLLFLKVSQHSVVIWSIRWHTSHNGCSLFHANGGERKDVDKIVGGHRCLTFLSNKFLTHDGGQTRILEIDFSHLLMSKVTRRSLADDEKVIVFHLIHSVLTLWEDKAVCLTVHGLRAQSSGNEEDITIAELCKAVRELEQSDFDTGVLLRSNTLTTASVMISTRLPFVFRENRVSLAEFDLIFVLKVMELPPDELIVVGILRRGNEVTSPVSVYAKTLKILFAEWWEEIEPVVWISKLRNFRLGDAHLHQDFILGQLWPLCIGRRSFSLLFCWLVATCVTRGDLTLQTDCSRGYGHTSAVECKGEQSAFANLSLIPSHEFGL